MLDRLLGAIRRPCVGVTLAATLVLGVGALLWWQFAWQSPQRVFEDMLANNLATTSVTKMASAGGKGQHVEQKVRLQMGSTNAADWLVAADQGAASVTTESIGTPTTGYIRYSRIVLPPKQGKQAAGEKPYDFSNVLNVWGKSDGKTDQTLDTLFSQTLLDITTAPLPPIGRLPEAQRQNILTFMRDQNVFEPDYKKVKQEKVNGRAVYSYAVAVKLGAYARMMQAFAHDLGLAGLDTVDSNQYSMAPPIMLTVSVDRISHLLARVSYPETGFSQQYADWGLSTPIAMPEKTIPTTELQNRLRALTASGAR